MKPCVENTSPSVSPSVCDMVLEDFHETQYRGFLQRIVKQA